MKNADTVSYLFYFSCERDTVRVSALGIPDIHIVLLLAKYLCFRFKSTIALVTDLPFSQK